MAGGSNPVAAQQASPTGAAHFAGSRNLPQVNVPLATYQRPQGQYLPAGQPSQQNQDVRPWLASLLGLNQNATPQIFSPYYSGQAGVWTPPEYITTPEERAAQGLLDNARETDAENDWANRH